MRTSCEERVRLMLGPTWNETASLLNGVAFTLHIKAHLLQRAPMIVHCQAAWIHACTHAHMHARVLACAHVHKHTQERAQLSRIRGARMHNSLDVPTGLPLKSKLPARNSWTPPQGHV